MTEGFEFARKKTIEYLNRSKIAKPNMDKAVLLDVARSSLRTKVEQELADHLAEICVDAVLAIRSGGKGAGDVQMKDIDLHMIEIMEMQHKSDHETQLVRGLVMDHGARHPDMKKRVEKAFILTCNVSLEYEKRLVAIGSGQQAALGSSSVFIHRLGIKTKEKLASYEEILVKIDMSWLPLSENTGG